MLQNSLAIILGTIVVIRFLKILKGGERNIYVRTTTTKKKNLLGDVHSLVTLEKDPFYDEEDEDDEEEADHCAQSHQRVGHQAFPLSVRAGPQTTCEGSQTCSNQ